jgi:ribosomal subunit interface protein
MNVSIQSVGFVGSTVLDNHVQQLLSEYLDSHQPTVASVEVTLSDQREPRGARVRRASMRITLHGMAEVESEAQSDDLYVAIRHCVQRAYRHLERRQRRNEISSRMARSATG